MTVQFHPDWPHEHGLVIEAMVLDGRYRTQFETGTSNGGLTAHPGGDRWRWESRLFGGEYDRQHASSRPIYGAWNRCDDVYGGSPRFGSAYLRLRPHVLENTTFCFPDSVFEPTEVGDSAALPRLSALADSAALDDLDDYVEAHVHSGLKLADDVEAVVLDPCHRDGAVAEAAGRLGCDVEFHPGFRLRTADLDVGFRGPGPVALARELGDVITPGVVARAARSGAYESQNVKRLWHLLARFGRQ
ncbi:DUF3626 domain-containing protein [Nesterenkonia sp. E16_7]|nr:MULTISPECIES: DUF3626 domain-containing protein [unclassified Nesterenkonia]MBO0596309.1 DUF3626 domain-containing protein [Nesterenkonia sp. E16_10]MBO0599736.1 DUF3626 domain-containing protein [Nesterenkonia sp. E16_7]